MEEEEGARKWKMPSSQGTVGGVAPHPLAAAATAAAAEAPAATAAKQSTSPALPCLSPQPQMWQQVGGVASRQECLLSILLGTVWARGGKHSKRNKEKSWPAPG